MTDRPGETFFRPEAEACERLTIPAALYNKCRLFLSRCGNPHVFVPIRSLQILAIIDTSEVIFVDSQAYAVQNGEGGRLICLAWNLRLAAERSDLTEPAPVELLYYRDDARELHGRLVGEFDKALDLLGKRMREEDCEPRAGRVVPFRS